MVDQTPIICYRVIIPIFKNEHLHCRSSILSIFLKFKSCHQQTSCMDLLQQISLSVAGFEHETIIDKNDIWSKNWVVNYLFGLITKKIRQTPLTHVASFNLNFYPKIGISCIPNILIRQITWKNIFCYFFQSKYLDSFSWF